VLGKLNVPDSRIDAIPEVDARAILANPRPPEGDAKARDVWDYLNYRYNRRRPADREPWSYRRWSRSHGLKQQQRAARRAKAGPKQPRERRTDRASEPDTDERLIAPEDPSDRDVAEARELMAGPRDLDQAADEAAATPSIGETLPGSNLERDATIIMAAGTAMEGPKVELWRRQLRRYQVLAKDQFDEVKWLAAIFPGGSRPDLVAIGDRVIIVGDIEARPRAAHWEKTVEYANRLIAGLPEEFAGYAVVAEERFWEHGFGHRTLKRVIRGRR
jgi:hypothetical protein